MSRYLDSINVKMAENGFTLSAGFKDPSKKEKNSTYIPTEYEDTVHESAESVMMRIKSLLGKPNSKKGAALSGLAVQSCRER